MSKKYLFEFSVKGPCDTLVGLTTPKEEAEKLLSRIPNRKAHISVDFKFHGDLEDIQEVMNRIFQ